MKTTKTLNNIYSKISLLILSSMIMIGCQGVRSKKMTDDQKSSLFNYIKKIGGDNILQAIKVYTKEEEFDNDALEQDLLYDFGDSEVFTHDTLKDKKKLFEKIKNFINNNYKDPSEDDENIDKKQQQKIDLEKQKAIEKKKKEVEAEKKNIQQLNKDLQDIIQEKRTGCDPRVFYIAHQNKTFCWNQILHDLGLQEDVRNIKEFNNHKYQDSIIVMNLCKYKSQDDQKKLYNKLRKQIKFLYKEKKKAEEEAKAKKKADKVENKLNYSDILKIFDRVIPNLKELFDLKTQKLLDINKYKSGYDFLFFILKTLSENQNKKLINFFKFLYDSNIYLPYLGFTKICGNKIQIKYSPLHLIYDDKIVNKNLLNIFILYLTNINLKENFSSEEKPKKKRLQKYLNTYIDYISDILQKKFIEDIDDEKIKVLCGQTNIEIFKKIYNRRQITIEDLDKIKNLHSKIEIKWKNQKKFELYLIYYNYIIKHFAIKEEKIKSKLIDQILNVLENMIRCEEDEEELEEDSILKFINDKNTLENRKRIISFYFYEYISILYQDKNLYFEIGNKKIKINRFKLWDNFYTHKIKKTKSIGILQSKAINQIIQHLINPFYAFSNDYTWLKAYNEFDKKVDTIHIEKKTNIYMNYNKNYSKEEFDTKIYKITYDSVNFCITQNIKTYTRRPKHKVSYYIKPMFLNEEVQISTKKNILTYDRNGQRAPRSKNINFCGTETITKSLIKNCILKNHLKIKIQNQNALSTILNLASAFKTPTKINGYILKNIELPILPNTNNAEQHYDNEKIIKMLFTVDSKEKGNNKKSESESLESESEDESESENENNKTLTKELNQILNDVLDDFSK